MNPTEISKQLLTIETDRLYEHAVFFSSFLIRIGVKEQWNDQQWWDIMHASIERIEQIDPQHPDFIVLCQRALSHWINYMAIDQQNACNMYDEILTRIEQTDWSDEIEAESQLQILDVFSHHSEVSYYPEMIKALIYVHPRILQIIQMLIHISATSSKEADVEEEHLQIIGAVAVKLFYLYFYHGFSYEGELNAAKTELALLVIPLIHAYPDAGDKMLISLFNYISHPAPLLAELIHVLTCYPDRSDEMYIDLAHDVFLHGYPDFIHHLEEIMVLLMPHIETWNEDQRHRFIYLFLDIDTIMDEERIQTFAQSPASRQFLQQIANIEPDLPEKAILLAALEKAERQ